MSIQRAMQGSRWIINRFELRKTADDDFQNEKKQTGKRMVPWPAFLLCGFLAGFLRMWCLAIDFYVYGSSLNTMREPAHRPAAIPKKPKRATRTIRS